MLRTREVTLFFLKKELFVSRLCPSLSEKVSGRFLADYEVTIEVACLGGKKLCLQAQIMQPKHKEREPKKHNSER